MTDAEFRQWTDRACITRHIKNIATLEPAAKNLLVGPIFYDTHRNAQLAKDGFVVFDLLDTAQIAQLNQHFIVQRSGEVARFYASSHEPEAEARLKMHDFITGVISEPLKSVLDQIDVLGSAYIAKPKGENGILPPHADWNIVDEDQYQSYNLWIPLVGTTPENGAIQLVPGSHRWFTSIRGPGIPNPYAKVSAETWDLLAPYSMQAGQALLYDHRLLHASGVNQTDQLRLATVTGIVPKGAPLLHYRKDDWAVRSYHSSVDFYLRENPETSPGDQKLRAVEAYGQGQLTPEQFRDLTGVSKSKEPEPENKSTSFWQVYSPGNVLREIVYRAQNLFS